MGFYGGSDGGLMRVWNGSLDLDLPRAGFKYKHVTRSRPLDWRRSFQLALVAPFSDHTALVVS